MRALREAGWLEYRPGAGEIVTNAGSSAYEIIQLLRRKLVSGDILPTVASLEHALSVGADKIGLLDSLYLKLTQDSTEIDDALASHSEVVLKATAKKIEEALSHSSHINMLLDRIPKDAPRTWRRIREIHDQLSRLHGRIAELHNAINYSDGLAFRAKADLSGGIRTEWVTASQRTQDGPIDQSHRQDSQEIVSLATCCGQVA